MNLDNILVDEVGQFGRYQMVTTSVIALILIFYAFATTEYDYTTAQIPHRCRIIACEGLSSEVPHPEFRPDWLLNAINGQSLYTIESCTRFASSASLTPSNDSCPADWFDRTREISCEEYVYENSNSAVYDFDLACDDWRRTILNSYATIATFQVLNIIARLADKKGRRSLLIITVFIAGCLGFVRSFITSYVWFLILRLLQICFGCGTFVFCYVLGIELAGPKYRAIVGAILSMMIPLGQLILGLMAWAVTSWRTLLLIIFTPQLLFISFFWIIPESVRWLICKEQYAQAYTILRKIAKVNKKQLSDKSIADLKALPVTANIDKKKPCTIRIIWKTPGMLPRIFINLLWYMTYSVSQYIMDEITINLVDSSHLNHIIVTAFAIPGIWTAACLLNRIGRKTVIIGSFLSCAACQLAFALLPQDGSIPLTIVYLLSKYFLAIVASSVNLYSVELFPTEQRSCIFGFLYMHTIMGQELGPYVVSLGPVSWMGLPSILFGILAVISAFLVKFTPETRDVKLPDNMDEAGQIGKEDNTHNIQSA